MKKTVQNLTKGFTLVELLIVIAIIAILAVVVAVIINPLELRRRANDSTRLSDLANLQQAINVAVQEATNSGAAILCSQTGVYPCNGDSTGGTAADRKPNGTGWVKVNLSSQNAVSVPTLPADPLNTTASHYEYCAAGDTWEINAVLESAATNGPKMINDGGNNVARYEVGSALDLIDSTTGVVNSGCAY